jgi:hypothetical protein
MDMVLNKTNIKTTIEVTRYQKGYLNALSNLIEIANRGNGKISIDQLEQHRAEFIYEEPQQIRISMEKRKELRTEFVKKNLSSFDKISKFYYQRSRVSFVWLNGDDKLVNQIITQARELLHYSPGLDNRSVFLPLWNEYKKFNKNLSKI